MVVAGQVAVGRFDDRPVVEASALGALAGGQAVPGHVRQGDGEVDRLLLTGPGVDHVVLGDGEDVAEAAVRAGGALGGSLP